VHRAVKMIKNSQPFGKNIRKPQWGDFLTHTVEPQNQSQYYQLKMQPYAPICTVEMLEALTL